MTLSRVINTIETVENRAEISNEVVKKLQSFTLLDVIDETTLFDDIELENTIREPIESRFGLIIMNVDWEQVKTVKDIVDIVERIMSREDRIKPNKIKEI